MTVNGYSVERSTSLLAVLCAMSTACGAAGSGAGSSETTTPPTELSMTVGPEGATLEGAASSPFEGIRLVIPAGALAEPTLVRILGGSDSTSLPPMAEDVGPQIRLEPDGTTLAIPAELTLPVNAGLVERLGQTSQDCKVWVREGVGWQRVEPSATADGSVTIPLSSLTTAAAGVIVTVRPLRCATCSPLTAIALLAGCVSPTGFCVQALNTVGRPSFSITTHGMDLYYGIFDAAVGPNWFRIVKLSVATGAEVRSFPEFLPAPVDTNNMAVDPDGSVWLGLGKATHHFLFANTTDPHNDYDGPYGLGAVVTGAGTLVRLSQIGSTARRGGAFEPTEEWSFLAASLGPGHSVAADPYYDAFFTYGGDTVLMRKIVDRESVGFGVPPPGSRYFIGAPIAVAKASGIQSPYVVARMEGGQLILANSYTGPTIPFGAPFDQVFDVAFDVNNGMWASSPSTPEVFYMGTSGAVSSLQLTTAPVGSATYAAALPRVIAPLSDGSVVVLRNDRTFMRLQLSGK